MDAKERVLHRIVNFALAQSATKRLYHSRFDPEQSIVLLREEAKSPPIVVELFALRCEQLSGWRSRPPKDLYHHDGVAPI